MTDDKAAVKVTSKLEEYLFREWWISKFDPCLTHYGFGLYAFRAGFDAGRKAERERCADICEQNATCEGIAQKIREQILGGQDGK